MILVIILIGIAIWASIEAPRRRSKHTAQCPKCGQTCKASPWGTAIQFEAKYKCPKCGHKFYEHYSKL